MHPLHDLKSWVAFGDEDASVLALLHPHAMSRAEGIVERFCGIARRFPAARELLGDDARQTRLASTLRVWLSEMLAGPLDEAWYERRRRVGDVHVRAGLPSHCLLTAMNVIVDEVIAAADVAFADRAEAAAAARAVRKVADLELAVMVGAYIDTRERRERDALSSLLFAHLPTTVLLLDAAHDVVAATARSSLLRHDHGPLREAVDPLVAAAFDLDALVDAAAATGNDEERGPLEVTDASGDRRLLRAVVVPLHHDHAWALVHLEDLTGPLTAEARAQQTEELARLGTMAASVAHEIRNPLAGISGTVQVIGASLPPDDPRRRALDKVREQVTRLGSLAGDLLTFARPITASVADVDLAAVARDVAADADAGNAVTAVGRVVRVVGAGRARADPALVREVLLALIENAWQAGARDVVVSVGDGVVDVKDDGPGVPVDVAGRIFEPFFTTKTRGTGLGLPVARRRAEAMGGALALAPADGGSCFSLRLPSERKGSVG